VITFTLQPMFQTNIIVINIQLLYSSPWSSKIHHYRRISWKFLVVFRTFLDADANFWGEMAKNIISAGVCCGKNSTNRPINGINREKLPQNYCITNLEFTKKQMETDQTLSPKHQSDVYVCLRGFFSIILHRIWFTHKRLSMLNNAIIFMKA
jgi:CRISPR/Cas system-associated protein endoribonuclease Cas2